MGLRYVAIMALSLLLPPFLGCDRGGLRIVPVRGNVTLDGQPVKDAAVMFVLKSGGRVATGNTDMAGNYSLTTHQPDDGAMEGQHTVTISLYRDEGSGGTNTPEGAVSGSGLVKTVWIVPQKYSDPTTSGLAAEVTREQSQYNFALTSQPAE